MIRNLLILLAMAALPHAANADAGHEHGKHTKNHPYVGHAADLGRPGNPKARNVRTIAITMTDDMRFQPRQITVVRGQTVKFVVTNAGQLKHEFVLGTEAELTEHAAEMEKFPEMEHDDPNMVTLAPGKTGTITWTFTRSGTWNVGFGCLIPGHFAAGMKGKIIVN